MWEDRRGVSGEQLPEPAIGSLGDDDGHVGSTTLWQLLHLLHHSLLIEPAAETCKSVPGMLGSLKACWKVVQGRVGTPTHDSPKLGSPKAHTQRDNLPACGTQH